MEELLLILGVVTFLFTLVSSKFDNSLITPPMVFTGAGVLAALLFRDFVEEAFAKEALEFVAELTLVILLFIDASRINLPLLFREHKIPVRLLGIGLPLTVLLGTVVARLMFGEFSIWEAAVVAAILAPTDAALGQAVVSSPKVPVRIRQSLNVESGLNDGMILPLVMLFAALASVSPESGEQSSWLVYWLMQVTLGPLVGVVAGFGGGYLLRAAKRRGNINENFLRLSGIAVAIVAWAGAMQIGGNGFIAAFVGGMCMSCFAASIGEPLRDFGEAEGQLFCLATFLLFGMIALVPAIQTADASCYVYAILSLTVIRMLPTALSLIGLKLRASTVFFLGWFGPRGLASLLFALLVVGEFDLPHADKILTISVLTVVLSMIAHGISAIPGSRWYASQLRKNQEPGIEQLEQKHCESHRNKFTVR
jgi:NhaP-type Na+/H+ or K+/H+ antiporter